MKVINTFNCNNFDFKRRKDQTRMAQKMTKEDKYEINQRNGFYMWAYNASINTVNNIQRVKDGEIWVPMYDDVRLKPCPKPPLKSFV
jgi:hypothetical protein